MGPRNSQISYWTEPKKKCCVMYYMKCSLARQRGCSFILWCWILTVNGHNWSPSWLRWLSNLIAQQHHHHHNQPGRVLKHIKVHYKIATLNRRGRKREKGGQISAGFYNFLQRLDLIVRRHQSLVDHRAGRNDWGLSIACKNHFSAWKVQFVRGLQWHLYRCYAHLHAIWKRDLWSGQEWSLPVVWLFFAT